MESLSDTKEKATDFSVAFSCVYYGERSGGLCVLGYDAWRLSSIRFEFTSSTSYAFSFSSFLALLQNF